MWIKVLLTQNDCVAVNGVCIKNIHLFNTCKVVIVHNIIASFFTSLDNGIIVSSFEGNPNDDS